MLQFIYDFVFPQSSHTSVVSMQQEAGFFGENEAALQRRGLTCIDSIQSVVRYDHAPYTRSVIKEFKYYRKRSLAYDLALLMHTYFPEEDIDPSATLVPVPLHWTRKFQRGFNQSELLAQQLGVRRNMSVKNLLRRTRPTGHQAWRGRKERLTAVENSFCIHSDSVPSTVILIDDLSTTGATLEACAQALKLAGVQRVEGWVIALA